MYLAIGFALLMTLVLIGAGVYINALDKKPEPKSIPVECDSWAQEALELGGLLGINEGETKIHLEPVKTIELSDHPYVQDLLGIEESV